MDRCWLDRSQCGQVLDWLTVADLILVETWTVQISNWRLAQVHGIMVLDISAKSGISAFAPDFGMVMKHKRGEVDDDEYTDVYVQRMRESLAEKPGSWEQLKRRSPVAFACYCRPDTFCHRHIFTDLVSKYLTKHGIEHKYLGEIKK